MKQFLLFALLSGVLLASGAEIIKTWSPVRDRAAISCRNGAQAVYSEKAKDSIKILLPPRKGQWSPCVAFVSAPAMALKRGETILITFKAAAARPLKGRIVVSQGVPPYRHASDPVFFDVTKEEQEFCLRTRLWRDVPVTEKVNLPLFLLDGAPGTAVKIQDVTIQKDRPLQKDKPAMAVAGDEFRPMASSRLYVLKGSALDLTRQRPMIPSGSLGRIIINQKGEFAFARRPDEAVRFFCCSFAHHEEQAMRTYTHAELDEFADAIARQGYNMIRFHYLDDMLTGTKLSGYYKDYATRPVKLVLKAEDVQFESRTLDRFRYFIAACGKRGIYVNLDLMSCFTGITNGTSPLFQMSSDNLTKKQLFVNPDFRRNFVAWTTRLLCDVNPYTGKALKDDPAVVMACCLNEQEILIPPRRYGKVFHEAWLQFVQSRYATPAEAAKAWCLPVVKTWADVPDVNEEVTTTSPLGRDMAKFCAAREAEMSEFYLREVGKIAPQLLLSNWNMRPRFMELPGRAKFPVIMLNYYHAHPTYGARTFVPQESALAYGGNIVKQFAALRFLDRPLVGTEYGIVFWNRYRHEQGLLCGSAAALQGWSGMTVFTNPVVYGSRKMDLFITGVDPIIRASQVVEYFAFIRQDVSLARHTVEFAVDDDLIFSGSVMRGIGDSLASLWPVCRIGLGYGPRRGKVGATMRIRPEKFAVTAGNNDYSTTKSEDTVDDAASVVAALRRKGVLGKDNRTDPAKGLFMSDTQEVFVNLQKREMRVVTPRLEGAFLKEERFCQLSCFTIRRNSVPASLVMISLDGQKDLGSTDRLLLVIATNALNSGMTFTNRSRDTVKSWGKLPVLVETGRFAGSVARQAANEKFHCYALDLTGKRVAEIPVKVSGKRLFFDFDTGKIAGGPALYFEFVKEK